MIKPEQNYKRFTNNNPIAIVIGGAGFIGSYVCESLLAQNVNVIVIDDLSSGKVDYLNKIKDKDNIQLLQLDINKSIPEIESAQYIFHIGGIESYINGLDLSFNTMLVNSVGTYHALELAKKLSAKFLLVSSLDIYSGLLSSISLKNYFGVSDRDNQKYSHHEAKRYAEALAAEYYRKFNLDVRVVRVSDVYGPRMDLNAGTEIAQLIKDALFTDQITVHGDGLKILYPTYVADVVAGISKAVFGRNTEGKIYNITSDQEVNVLNFAYTIQKNSTKPLKIQFTQDYQEVKFPIRKIELLQTQSELGWKAKTNLAEGITFTLEYFFLKLGEKDSKDKKETKQKSVPIETKTELKHSKPEISSLPLAPQPAIEQRFEQRALPSQKAKQKTTESKKINKLNVVVVSSSLFIVLVLFIFPLVTLMFSTHSAILKSEETIQTAVGHGNAAGLAAESQKNIYVSNVQFDTLEWFFNLLRKRNQFEQTRTMLQSLDKINGAVRLNETRAEYVLNATQGLLAGKGKGTENSEYTKHAENTIFLFQKAVLESQSTAPNLLPVYLSDKYENIQSSLPELSKQYQDEILIGQNIIQTLSSVQKKQYIILVQNTIQATTDFQATIGYIAVTVDKTGISNLEYKAVSKIKEKNLSELANNIILEQQNSSGIKNTTLLSTNTYVAKKLLDVIGAVTLKEYAEVVNSTNIETKHNENSNNPNYILATWKEILNNLRSLPKDKYAQLGKIIQESIQSEDFSLINVAAANDRSYRCVPYSDLETRFTNTTQDEETKDNPLCIEISQEQQTKQAASSIKKEVSTTLTEGVNTAQYKIQYKVNNPSKLEYTETLTVKWPGKPKITDLKMGTPLSFDRVKTSESPTSTEYSVEITIPANSEKTLEMEWQDTSRNINTYKQSGLKVLKPINTPLQKMSVTYISQAGEKKELTVPNASIYLKQ